MAKISLNDKNKLTISKGEISKNIINSFKINLEGFINNINEAIKNKENEEHIKNIINDFLRMNFYNDSKFTINTDGNIDSAIKERGKLLAIIETKLATNKSEMVTSSNLNKKALWELTYYFLEKTIDITKSKPMISTDAEIRRLIITDGINWYLIDAASIYSIIDGEIERRYFMYKKNQLPYKNDTTSFYEELRQHFEKIDITKKLDFVYFNIGECIKNKTLLATLYKVLSETYLLKNNVTINYEPHKLNKYFYHELLYIMGLKEVNQDNKLVVEIDHSIKNSLSNQVYRLLKDKEINENSINEVTFEIVLIWINRLLFIKLFEGQLIAFNGDLPEYHIISREKINNFDDLQSLFFDVLGT